MRGRRLAVPYPDAQRAKDRRVRNDLTGACINDTLAGTHGLATHGVRCFRCYLVHMFGAVVAREMDAWRQFVPVPVEAQQAA